MAKDYHVVLDSEEAYQHLFERFETDLTSFLRHLETPKVMR